jgi:hypothetical protein
MAAGEEAEAREDAEAEAREDTVVVAEAGIRPMKELNRKKAKLRQKVNKMTTFILCFSFYYAVIESRAREYLS